MCKQGSIERGSPESHRVKGFSSVKKGKQELESPDDLPYGRAFTDSISVTLLLLQRLSTSQTCSETAKSIKETYIQFRGLSRHGTPIGQSGNGEKSL